MDQPWSLLPPAFLEQLNSIIPHEKLDVVFAALSVERRPSIRINTIKVSVDEALKILQKEGIDYKQILWCKEALLIGNEQKLQVMQSRLSQEGMIYSQSLSSILATIVLDPKPFEEILDLCAAPGSKTSHIAALMENKGAIIANDASRSRVFKLQANMKTLGVLNTKITCLPGEWMWKKYLGMFDRVLVDAPCSMEGRFVATDPDTYKDWKPAKGKLLSQKQKYLLRSAVACTKPGGVTVYSTCTLNPRENEEVVDWVLSTERDQVVLEEIKVSGVDFEKGFVEWKNKKFNPDLQKTVRILPSETMEGFFLAKLRKKIPNIK